MSELQQEPTAMQGEGRYVLGEPIVDDRAPDSPIGDRWDDRKFSARLVNPANRRKMNVIVVGTGLSGWSSSSVRTIIAPTSAEVPAYDSGSRRLKK